MFLLRPFYVRRVDREKYHTALIISCVASFRSLFTNREPPMRHIPSSSEQQVQGDKREKRPRDPYPMTEFLITISESGTQALGRDPGESFSQSDESLDDGFRVVHEFNFGHENP